MGFDPGDAGGLLVRVVVEAEALDEVGDVPTERGVDVDGLLEVDENGAGCGEEDVCPVELTVLALGVRSVGKRGIETGGGFGEEGAVLLRPVGVRGDFFPGLGLDEGCEFFRGFAESEEADASERLNFARAGEIAEAGVAGGDGFREGGKAIRGKVVGAVEEGADVETVGMLFEIEVSAGDEEFVYGDVGRP